jgi:hypothetical protein
MNPARTGRAALVLALLAAPLQPAAAQSDFARLVTRLSEPGGYFDSDNLVSNEASYLHVLPSLRALGVRGGVYLGVGPEQNFSYIAAVQPEWAIMVDIRRDNLLLHLLFRAIFETSRNRIEYLCQLFGRRPPAQSGSWTGRPLVELLFYLDTAGLDTALHERTHESLVSRIARYGIPLSPEDRRTLQRFHGEFAFAGLNLTFSSRGGLARRTYPNLRRLYQETDALGESGSYLSSETRWRVVRDLQRRGRIVPVTGDLAGRQALPAIAAWLRQERRMVTAFYVSNVEMYLFRFGTFSRFAENLAALPAAPNAVVIRSIFDRFAAPRTADYFSAQSLQSFARLLELAGYRPGLGYWDLVSDAEPAVAGPPR